MEKADVIRALKKFGDVEKDIRLIKEEISTIELQQKTEAAETRLARLQCQISELELLRNSVQKETDKLPYSQRAVIIGKYVWRWKWVKIARYIHYSKRSAQYIFDKTLYSLAKDTAFENVLNGIAFFDGDDY